MLQNLKAFTFLVAICNLNEAAYKIEPVTDCRPRKYATKSDI